MKYYNNKGITLLETLIAITIMSLLLLSAISLMTSLWTAERRNRAISEVDFQASQMLYDIAQSARNSTSITAPLKAATSSSLTLVVSGVPTETPTIYSLAS